MNLKKIFTMKSLHIISLIAIIGVIAIAALAFIDGDTAYLQVFQLGKIEVGKCFYRENFGISCPSCGLTRSFIAIENFNFIQSLRYNRVGFLVYLLMIFTLIFNIFGILKAKSTLMIGKLIGIYGFIVCVLLVGNWIYKIFL